MAYAESKARWQARMREEGRCLCCGGIWDGETTLCLVCSTRKNERRNAVNAATRQRLEAAGLARPRGTGGFADHPENRYRCPPGERSARAKRGGAKSAQARMSSGKWQAVKAVVDAGFSWAVVADLYDLAYARGSGAAKERGRRAVQSDRRALQSDAAETALSCSSVAD